MNLDRLKNQLMQKQPLFIGEESAFKSAILIPLVQVEGEWHILFEVRSFTMRNQPGDISFPGGRIDKDDLTPMDAAIRETTEELGVSVDKIRIIGHLSPYIASSSFVIYPFIATVDYNQINHSYNKAEVEEVFTVPMEWFLTNEPYMHKVAIQPIPSEDFPFDKIMNGSNYQWRTRAMEEWFYDYGKYTIWGLTARILKHFIEIIK